MVDGLEYLHTNNIIHRDLKPENLYLDHNNSVIIGDFGCAEIYTKPLRNSKGTYHFMAPETFLDDDLQSGFDGKKADI